MLEPWPVLVQLDRTLGTSILKTGRRPVALHVHVESQSDDESVTRLPPVRPPIAAAPAAGTVVTEVATLLLTRGPQLLMDVNADAPHEAMTVVELPRMKPGGVAKSTLITPPAQLAVALPAGRKVLVHLAPGLAFLLARHA